MEIGAERHGLLAAGRYRDYRLLWVCTLGIYTGVWIEAVVVSWLVLELTDSPFLVGLLGTCRFIAMFLGPFCGAISDRHDRRHILIRAQFVMTGASLIMMGLSFTSRLGFTLNLSTPYAASDIVRNSHVVSAVSLLMVSTGVTTIFGPLPGGNSSHSLFPPVSGNI